MLFIITIINWIAITTIITIMITITTTLDLIIIIFKIDANINDNVTNEIITITQITIIIEFTLAVITVLINKTFITNITGSNNSTRMEW